MRLRLLAFATAADALGANETTFEMTDGSSVGDLRAALVQAARFLWRRGGATRQDVEQIDVEKMTHPELRDELSAAFAEEASGPPSAKKLKP